MKKKISLVLLCGVMVLGLCGCDNNKKEIENNNNNNQSQTTNNSFVLTKENIIGTWNYGDYGGTATTITISENEIDFGGRVSNYEIHGNWILLTNKDIGAVLYVIDENNIVGLEGVHITK